MVEYTLNLDDVFRSLADPTRRDILRRVCEAEQTITELAEKYDISFAAVAKHLNVLEKAQLVIKRKEGVQQKVLANPVVVDMAAKHLQEYEAIWQQRYDNLERMLEEE
ncbi:winged helix-turn-helix transcriptional regulator [Candidatus Saccharibacteria bacterium]|nr:winged helix-turn-helix transcriptional regulator [Candidatus Saccharibacteria bacterium]